MTGHILLWMEGLDPGLGLPGTRTTNISIGAHSACPAAQGLQNGWQEPIREGNRKLYGGGSWKRLPTFLLLIISSPRFGNKSAMMTINSLSPVARYWSMLENTIGNDGSVYQGPCKAVKYIYGPWNVHGWWMQDELHCPTAEYANVIASSLSWWCQDSSQTFRWNHGGN